MARWTVTRVIAVAVGLVLTVLGLWALIDPGSFYDQVANYPPYNRHLLHDIGAFQTGIGATLLLTFLWTDAPLVALSGASVGSVLHFVSHVIDRDEGGRTTDPATVGLLALVVVAAAVWRRRQIRRR